MSLLLFLVVRILLLLSSLFFLSNMHLSRIYFPKGFWNAPFPFRNSTRSLVPFLEWVCNPSISSGDLGSIIFLLTIVLEPLTLSKFCFLFLLEYPRLTLLLSLSRSPSHAFLVLFLISSCWDTLCFPLVCVYPCLCVVPSVACGVWGACVWVCACVLF